MKAITFFLHKFSLSLCDMEYSNGAEERCGVPADILSLPYCSSYSRFCLSDKLSIVSSVLLR